METSNNKPDTRVIMSQWRKDANHFLKKEFISVNAKIVNEDDIEKMWDWELIYLQYWCGMGTSDVFNEIGILENWKINYYRKYIYKFETHKEMWPGFLSLKSFKWLEDYDNNKIYHKVLGYESENKLKNFEVIGLNFWNYVIVNKEFVNDYKSFIEKLTKKYDLSEDFFWIHITEVSKIYHSGKKEEFLSSIETF